MYDSAWAPIFRSLWIESESTWKICQYNRYPSAQPGGTLNRAAAGIPDWCTWESPDKGECLVDAILTRYFDAREDGKTLDVIAKEVFKVQVQKLFEK